MKPMALQESSRGLGLMLSRAREGCMGKAAHPILGSSTALQTGGVMGLASD